MGGAAHPAPRLSDVGARLAGVRLFSPRAEGLRAALAPLISDARVTVLAADTPRMEAVIATPMGEVVL